jgi:hypothetical protein
MNCKPGDLAVIIRDRITENIGLLVEVQDDLDSHWQDDPCPHWLVVSRGKPLLSRLYDDGAPIGEFEYAMDAYVPDADLRPIRDPGDDAQDETLDWLPVPSKETV